MLKFLNKSEIKRCRKHDNAKILYTGETCPLCDINERLEQLIITVDRVLEVNEKISSVSKSMSKLF